VTQTSNIAAVLREGDRFAVLSHINPDGDAVGSVLGMYAALKEMGKQAWALTDEPFPEMYEFLPGCREAMTKEACEKIVPDWIICLDVASEKRTSVDVHGMRQRARLINIDHHITNNGYGDVNLVEPQATSTAELVYRVLKEMGCPLSVDVAKCLYTGLITDTGCFRFSGVREHTMRLAAELLSPGLDSYQITRYLYEEYPIHRMELERLLLSRVELKVNGILAMSHLHYKEFEALGAAMSDGENLVDRLRENRGVEVGVLLTQVSEDTVRASFRSKDLIDVSAIAAVFGGGGHRRAAGLRSKLPMDELKNRIILEVQRTYSGSQKQSRIG
jgi:phosphoesterase RecJ-like protein